MGDDLKKFKKGDIIVIQEKRLESIKHINYIFYSQYKLYGFCTLSSIDRDKVCYELPVGVLNITTPDGEYSHNVILNTLNYKRIVIHESMPVKERVEQFVELKGWI